MFLIVLILGMKLSVSPVQAQENERPCAQYAQCSGGASGAQDLNHLGDEFNRIRMKQFQIQQQYCAQLSEGSNASLPNMGATGNMESELSADLEKFIADVNRVYRSARQNTGTAACSSNMRSAYASCIISMGSALRRSLASMSVAEGACPRKENSDE